MRVNRFNKQVSENEMMSGLDWIVEQQIPNQLGNTQTLKNVKKSRTKIT